MNNNRTKRNFLVQVWILWLWIMVLWYNDNGTWKAHNPKPACGCLQCEHAAQQKDLVRNQAGAFCELLVVCLFLLFLLENLPGSLRSFYDGSFICK